MKTSKAMIAAFFISAAILLFEVFLVRLFSISLWHHFSYLAIAIALLGLGAAGLFLSRHPFSSPYPALLFSFLIYLPLFLMRPVDPFRLFISFSETAWLSLLFFSLILPFFAGGLVISSLLKGRDKGKIYFGVMLGSSSGALLSLLLSSQTAIIISSLFGALSFLALSKGRERLSVFLLIILFLAIPQPAPEISPYKPLSRLLDMPDSFLLKTEHSPSTRLDIVRTERLRYAPGLSSLYKDSFPSQTAFFVDGGSMTVLSDSTEFALFMPVAFPFEIGSYERCLSISNPLSAQLCDMQDIETVLLDQNALRSSELQKHLPFKVIHKNPHSFSDSWDLIFLPFPDSTGGFSLKEDFILTKEFFEKSFDALSPSGMIVVESWLSFPPRDLPRLASITEHFGEDKVIALRTLSTTSLFIRKESFSPDDVLAAKEFSDRMGFDVVYAPGISSKDLNRNIQLDEPIFYKAVANEFSSPSASPTYNWPFFHSFHSWTDLPFLISRAGREWNPMIHGGHLLLLFTFFLVAFLSSLFILFPLGSKIIPYFSLIGAAYILLQIAWLEKAILLFSEPSIAFGITLASMLLFSSLGSFFSKKLKRNFLLFLFIPYLPIFFNLHHLLSFPPLPRYLAFFFIPAPLSFFMGVPFPSGLEEIEKKEIPGAYGIDAFSSVIFSVVAAMLYVTFGFNSLFFASALFYTAALKIGPGLSLGQI